MKRGRISNMRNTALLRRSEQARRVLRITCAEDRRQTAKPSQGDEVRDVGERLDTDLAAG